MNVGRYLRGEDRHVGTARTTQPQPPQRTEQEPVAKYCCHLCFNKSGSLLLDRMILCPECGNKRCPKATNHELECTNSNKPNQAGSIYTTQPQRTWVGMTDEEILSDDTLRYYYGMNGGAGPVSQKGKKVIAAIEAKLKQKNGYNT